MRVVFVGSGTFLAGLFPVWWVLRLCRVASHLQRCGCTPQTNNMLQKNPWALLLQQLRPFVGVVDPREERVTKHRDRVFAALYIFGQGGS